MRLHKDAFATPDLRLIILDKRQAEFFRHRLQYILKPGCPYFVMTAKNQQMPLLVPVRVSAAE
jgi:hypothetical protein